MLAKCDNFFINLILLILILTKCFPIVLNIEKLWLFCNQKTNLLNKDFKLINPLTYLILRDFLIQNFKAFREKE